jgi:hypothetical protein
MSQDCQNIVNHLIDIVENNLPESLKKAILDHLALCPQCNRLVQSYSHAWKGLSTKEKLEPSESFWPELLAKIEASEKSQPFREKIITGFRNSLRPAAVSLILLFGVFFGYQLGTAHRPETSPSEMSSQYIEQYLQDFQDFPYGSVGDFFTKYEIPLQEEKP